MAICLHCGKEFTPKRNAVYCSDRCRANASNERLKAKGKKTERVKKPYVPELHHCAVCGKEFYPKRKDSAYCSPNCRLKANRAKKALASNGVYIKLSKDNPQSALQVERLVQEGTPIKAALKAVMVSVSETIARLGLDVITKDSAGQS